MRVKREKEKESKEYKSSSMEEKINRKREISRIIRGI